MADDYQRYKMWATTISRMLKMPSTLAKYQLQFCKYWAWPELKVLHITQIRFNNVFQSVVCDMFLYNFYVFQSVVCNMLLYNFYVLLSVVLYFASVNYHISYIGGFYQEQFPLYYFHYILYYIQYIKTISHVSRTL